MSLPSLTPLTVRVILPYHLRKLAHVGAEVALQVVEPVTIRRVLDALEAAYPMLRGTIREYETGERRPSFASSPAQRTGHSSRSMRRCHAR